MRTSWARIAVRTGAVSREALRRAARARRSTGATLEQALLESGALDPDVARFVREAWRRARHACGRCGRLPRARARGERPCACYSGPSSSSGESGSTTGARGAPPGVPPWPSLSPSV